MIRRAYSFFFWVIRRNFRWLLRLGHMNGSESQTDHQNDDGFLTHTGLFTAVHSRLSRAFFLPRDRNNGLRRWSQQLPCFPLATLSVRASPIADGRMMLAGYRLADLLTRVVGR